MSKIKRYDEIMENMLANMIAKQDKITDFNEGSVIHTILDTMARVTERLYVSIRQGYNELLGMIPYSLFGFEKKEGLYASGEVVFSRDSVLTSQSVIPKGTVVSGGGLKFITTVAGEIPANEKDSSPIEVIAENTGTSYNIESNTIDSIDTVVPADVVSVKNNFSFYGGTDIETDAEFEERFKFYINGLSGTNTYAIKNAALSVNSVRSVSVQNHKPPLKDIYNLSVYVDDGSGSASEETIEKVKLAIEGDGTQENQGHLAPGINVRVLAPSSIPVNLNLVVTCYSRYLTEARIELQSVLTSHINTLTIGEPVILSKIVSRLMEISWIKDVKIILPENNIEPSINQIARFGTVDVSFIEED